MIYDLPLKAVGLVVGALLVAVHLAALAQPRAVQGWLGALPRSRPWGLALCAAATIWAFWLAATMDLGEFTPNRTLICLMVLLGGVLMPLFADELLAARAVGFLALLAAEPLLDAAFLRPQSTRLLLVCVAYAWAILGLILVGAPYVLRDLIRWFSASATRWRLAATAGLAYGAALIACALLFFGER